MGASLSLQRKTLEKKQLSASSATSYQALNSSSDGNNSECDIEGFIKENKEKVDGGVAVFLLELLRFQEQYLKNSAKYQPVVHQIAQQLLTFFDNPKKDLGVWNGIDNQVSVIDFAELVSLKKESERGSGSLIAKLLDLRLALVHIRVLVTGEELKKEDNQERKVDSEDANKEKVRDYFLRSFSAPVLINNLFKRYIKLDSLLFLSSLVQSGVLAFSLMEGCFWKELPCPSDDVRCVSSDFSKNEFFRHPVLYSIFFLKVAYVVARLLSGFREECRRSVEKKKTIQSFRNNHPEVGDKVDQGSITEIEKIIFAAQKACPNAKPLNLNDQEKSEALEKNSRKMLASFLYNLRSFYTGELKSSSKYVPALGEVLTRAAKKGELSKDDCQEILSYLMRLLYRKRAVSKDYYSKFQTFYGKMSGNVQTSHHQRRRSTKYKVENPPESCSENNSKFEILNQKFAYLILNETDRRPCLKRYIKLPKDPKALVPFVGMFIAVMYTLLDDCFNSASRCASLNVTCTDNAGEWVREKMAYHMVLTVTTGLSLLTTVGALFRGCVRQRRTEKVAHQTGMRLLDSFHTASTHIVISPHNSDGETKTP